MEKEKRAALLRADNIAPILLSTAVVSSTAYIYACGIASAALWFAAISAVYSLVLFLVYDKLRSIGKNWLTTIVVLGSFLVIQFLGFALADMRSVNDIGLWFMEPSRYTELHYGNTYMLIAILGFVLISCLYYFTMVRYRGIYVFLICMCPFCLFAKTFTDIPVIFPIIIMTLFFFIMTGHSGSANANYGKGLIKTVLAFVLAVTVIASFFPKMTTTPYREEFDEFITGVSIGAAGRADFSDFTDNSSGATSKNDDETVIMSFYGDNPLYIKRQCFNIYDRDTNTWGYYGNSNEGHSNFQRYTRFEDPGDLYKECGFSDEEIYSRKCIVRFEEGGMKALYTPDNIVSLELYNTERKIYRTELDEFFVGNENNDTVRAYTMEWVDFVLNREFTEKLTDEYAEELSGSGHRASSDAASYIRAKEQAVQYSGYLMSDEVMDKCYSSADARARVRELAESITLGFESDPEKAAAIVDYFRSGEYIYDRDFTTPNGSPDNFIFGTKRGACAAYATAMTLMCRELGMTARYCEGFLVDKYEKNGSYWYVTPSDSHAFVQVWIDGYGWTSFDPTSGTKDDGYFDVTFLYVGAAAAAIFLIGALAVLFRPFFEEKRFVKRMRSSRGTAQYSMIYRKINAMVNAFEGSTVNRLTPTDTADKCAELFGYDINGFVQSYEEAVYGGTADERADSSAVYTGFVSAYKAKRRKERKRRKNGDLRRGRSNGKS
jgi:transglutaminase-like putative cysteine protease